MFDLPWLIAGGVALVVALWLVFTWNRLQRMRVEADNAFRQIDVQLQRRHDLIPNLVSAVRGAMQRERETLEAVVEARAKAVVQREATRGAGDARGLFDAENLLSGALGRLLAVVEAYPELKSQARVGELMEELRTTENRVAFARQAYNDAVEGFNVAIGQFPTLLVAGPFGFAARAWFEVPEQSDARAVPKVELA
jgi:LemA protein